MFRPTLISAIFIGLFATQSAAKPPLKDVERIREDMITIGIADTIRTNCATISARMIKAYFFLQSAKSHAQSLGYTKVEIDAYVSNDAEKARLLGIAYGRLAELGVATDQPETYCTAGLAQIASGTAVGNLLKAK